MTNEERRLALASARRKALEYAQAVESPVRQRELAITPETALARATMWAHVANAMKVGQSLEADGVIPELTDGYITR